MYPGPGSVTLATLRSLGTLLQPITTASTALSQRSGEDISRCTLCGLHERNAGLDLNIFTHQDFLERASSAPPSTACATCKSTEQVLKVDIRCTPKSTTGKATPKAAKATKSTETTCTRKRVSTRGTWIEATILIKGGCAKSVVVFSLLGIGKELISGLSLCKLVFGVCFLVGVRVVFFRLSVVCFFDIASGSTFVDSKDFVWIRDCLKGSSRMESL